MLDLIIVGGGPAGLNAALYAARAGLDAVLFEKMFAGGQMMTTTTFENYLGFPNGVAAVDRALNMEEQAKTAAGLSHGPAKYGAAGRTNGIFL